MGGRGDSLRLKMLSLSSKLTVYETEKNEREVLLGGGEEA